MPVIISDRDFPRDSRRPFETPLPNIQTTLERSIESVNPEETFPILDDDAFYKYKKLIAWRIAWIKKKLSPDMTGRMMRYLFRTALGIEDGKQEKPKKGIGAKKGKKTKQRANEPFNIYINSDAEIPTCLRTKAKKLSVKEKASEELELVEDPGSEGSTDLDDLESSGEKMIYYSFCHRRWESSRNWRHCPFCCFSGDQKRQHCEDCGECQSEEICEYCGGESTASRDLSNPDD